MNTAQQSKVIKNKVGLLRLAELCSIGAVLPFLGVLTAPESVFNHQMAQPLIHALDITEPKQLLVFLTLMFGVAAVVSGGVEFKFLVMKKLIWLEPTTVSAVN